MDDDNERIRKGAELDGGPDGPDDYTAAWIDEIINGNDEAFGLGNLNAFGVEIIMQVWGKIAFDPQFWSSQKRKERI